MFNLSYGFLKSILNKDPILFIPMKLMNDFMQENNALQNMPPTHKGRLGRFNNFISNPYDLVFSYLHKKIITYIQQTYVFTPRLFLLRQGNYTKV
jgi:hypothetical protein